MKKNILRKLFLNKRILRNMAARPWIILGAMAVVTTASGCRDITETKLPDGVEGPGTYNNRDGAMRLTQATRSELAVAVAKYIVSSGLLTDELRAGRAPDNFHGSQDQRTHYKINVPPHATRAFARQARGVVGKYVSGETSGWKALLWMYEAYALILTADGWCSGVPLSTMDFEGDWTLQPGSSTDEIYESAIQLLDSAAEYSSDSVSLQSAIKVLKGRALLALGRYSEAKQTVQNVDAAFGYTIRIAFDNGNRLDPNFLAYESFLQEASVTDKEGINGLPYISSNDPRSRARQLRNRNNELMWFPEKYITADSSTFTVASGIEAQLTLAEAALHEQNPQSMLGILNSLRTVGTYTVDTVDVIGGGQRIDTLWNAGTGKVAGLGPLQLPGTTEGQRHLLFSERAAWLFLTGSRQADLRRLVRKYGVSEDRVYPTGVYSAYGYTGIYGQYISFGLDDSEYRNPLFRGCKFDD